MRKKRNKMYNAEIEISVMMDSERIIYPTEEQGTADGSANTAELIISDRGGLYYGGGFLD